MSETTSQPTTAREIRFEFKRGDVDISWEGPRDFLQNGLLSLVDELLLRTASSRAAASPHTETRNDKKERTPLEDAKLSGTTATLAAKLPVKSGHDLVLAAAAQLTFVQGKDVFARHELLDEMRSAVSIFTPTHRKNLSQTLGALMRGRKLIEKSADSYALEATAREELLRRLV